jgi:hypothetical protein
MRERDLTLLLIGILHSGIKFFLPLGICIISLLFLGGILLVIPRVRRILCLTYTTQPFCLLLGKECKPNNVGYLTFYWYCIKQMGGLVYPFG